MGSHTYNDVYGTTRNPYEMTRSAGGSSGGAGAALAAGMLPLADGSDLGGSLRNPGNFNNVVGFRPSVGLVPRAAPAIPELPVFAVNGPMARSVEDAAFLLAVMSARSWQPLGRDFRGTNVAWSIDLGGLPLDRQVRDVLDAQRTVFESLGCRTADASPDLSDADSVFLTIRRKRSAAEYGPLLDRHRSLMKPEAVEEISTGLALTAVELERAVRVHGTVLGELDRFERRFEFLVCAVNQMPPFDASLTWPAVVDGVPMRHYIEWMKSTYWISVTGRPAISVPAGFTPDGLPVGIQIVGRAGDDIGVLQLAHAFEQATRFGERRPPIVSA
jgi:amidase